MLPGYSRSRCRNALLFIAVSAPLIAWYGETLPSHNEIETWLPTNSVQRREYDRFKEYFGAEEFVLVGMSTTRHDADLIEAVCCRIESLDSIRACWSPARMTTVMDDLEVPEELIRDRLRGLTMSWDGEFAGLLAILNNNGLANRAGTVDSIRSVLDYCRIPRDEVHLAGSPVVVAELDRLGSRDNNLLFFGAACAISFVLLLSVFRHWKVAAAVFALTLWAIEVTLAILHLFDGEMNFILSALPVMVMVFTLTVAIHFVHYYRQAKSTIDPIRSALRNAMWPCFLATATTVIGLLSLATSDMRPVRLFGLSAAVGCVVALVTGLFLTPAVLVLYPLPEPSSTPINRRPLTFAASLLFRRSGTFALAAFALVAVSAIGLTRLKSNIDPLEFLPANSKVLADVRLLQQRIGNTSSIEAVVDFRNEDLPFVAKLDAVQNFERRLCSNPAVIDTISVGTFLPLSLPENTLDAARVLGRAQGSSGQKAYLNSSENLWRVSIRFSPKSDQSVPQLMNNLRPCAGGLNVRFTGVTPLLEYAQQRIFVGFWTSFSTAFVIISLVMMLALRSVSSGCAAMIPNLTPICIVFGFLGWIGEPLDIGIMMTASIALGLAVDGTFHFLVAYHRSLRHSSNPCRAVRFALLHTGAPISQAAVVSGLGMLALTLSSFRPTVKFGFLMTSLLFAALIGDLVLLPAILHLRGKRRRDRSIVPAPLGMLRRRPRVRTKLDEPLAADT